MRLIELVGLLFITAIWMAVVIPLPCIPPYCGPPDAEPFSNLQVFRIYLYYTWPLVIMWVVMVVIWLKRSST